MLTSRSVKAYACSCAMLAAAPLAAQDALDRTNPGAQVTRDELPPAPPAQVRIAVQPVLDMPLDLPGGEPLDVGAIVIDGLIALDRAAFAAVIEPYAGRPLDGAELTRLADAVAARARDEGYILATAWIPE